MTSTKTHLLLRITPRSPLVLGNQSGISNYQETSDFIPGSALRGAVAHKLITACLHQNHLTDHADCPDPQTCPYHQLFGVDEPVFGDGYPGSLGPVWPLPLTARTCKRHPGWQLDEKSKKKDAKQAELESEDNGHGVWDVLLADFAYGLISDPYYPDPARPYRSLLQPTLGTDWSNAWQPANFTPVDRCRFKDEAGKTCDGRLKPHGGYYAWHTDGPVSAKLLAHSRITHVGINRARSVAQDELLFTQESLQATASDQAFFAEIVVTADKAARLTEAVLGVHYVGRGRSRGHGEVFVALEERSLYPTLADRLENFQLATTAVLTSYHRKDSRVQTHLPGQLFSLTCHTPAILQEGGRPLRLPPPAAIGLPDEVLLLQGWARMEQVGGWHSAAELPRRTQLAAKAGTVFLYFAPETVPETTLLAALETLENDGIGEERARGYGRVAVCAPFHTLQSGL